MAVDGREREIEVKHNGTTPIEMVCVSECVCVGGCE